MCVTWMLLQTALADTFRLLDLMVGLLSLLMDYGDDDKIFSSTSKIPTAGMLLALNKRMR